MQFLIDEENGCGYSKNTSSQKKYLEVDRMLEKALDGKIFEKYMTLTRVQALKSSSTFCKERI